MFGIARDNGSPQRLESHVAIQIFLEDPKSESIDPEERPELSVTWLTDNGQPKIKEDATPGSLLARIHIRRMKSLNDPLM